MGVDGRQKRLIAQVFKACVAAHGQIGTIHLQMNSITGYDVILLFQYRPYGFKIGLIGRVIGVFHKQGHRSWGWRGEK